MRIIRVWKLYSTLVSNVAKCVTINYSEEYEVEFSVAQVLVVSSCGGS